MIVTFQAFNLQASDLSTGSNESKSNGEATRSRQGQGEALAKYNIGYAPCRVSIVQLRLDSDDRDYYN